MGSPKSDLRTLGLSLGVVSEESAVVFTWGSPTSRFNNKTCHFACKVLERMLVLDGESLARITKAEPWGLETTNGLSEFEVNESDLIK